MARVKIKDEYVSTFGIISIKLDKGWADKAVTRIRYITGESIVLHDITPEQVMAELGMLRRVRFRRR